MNPSCQAQEEAEGAHRKGRPFEGKKRSSCSAEGGQTYWNSRWDVVCWRLGPQGFCQSGASEDQPGCGLHPEAREGHLPALLVPLWAQRHSKEPPPRPPPQPQEGPGEPMVCSRRRNRAAREGMSSSQPRNELRGCTSL